MAIIIIALRIKHLLYFGSLTYSYLSVFIFFSLFSLSLLPFIWIPRLSLSFRLSHPHFYFLKETFSFSFPFWHLYTFTAIFLYYFPHLQPAFSHQLRFFSYILFLKLHYLPRHFNFSLFNFSFIRYPSSRKINTSSNMSVNLIVTYICTLFLKSVILYI